MRETVFPQCFHGMKDTICHRTGRHPVNHLFSQKGLKNCSTCKRSENEEFLSISSLVDRLKCFFSYCGRENCQRELYVLATGNSLWMLTFVSWVLTFHTAQRKVKSTLITLTRLVPESDMSQWWCSDHFWATYWVLPAQLITASPITRSIDVTGDSP